MGQRRPTQALVRGVPFPPAVPSRRDARPSALSPLRRKVSPGGQPRSDVEHRHLSTAGGREPRSQRPMRGPLVCSPPPRVACSRTTTSPAPRKRERPGGRPVSHHIGAVSAAQEVPPRSLRRSWTEAKPAVGVCALPLRLNVTANVSLAGVGDGLQPDQTPPPRGRPAIARAPRSLSPASAGLRSLARSPGMSHAAIAGVLRLEDVSASERLAAFSLASFANREHRAWPGTRLAAARAGLSRSQYLAARDGLVRRGLVVVEEPGGGRGRSPVIALHFAETRPVVRGERQRRAGGVRAQSQPDARISARAAGDPRRGRRRDGRVSGLDDRRV